MTRSLKAAALHRLKNLRICAILLKGRFRSSLIASDSCFGWLGLDYNKFKAILNKKKIDVLSLSIIDAISNKDSCSLPQPELCRKLAEYPALVESEKCRPDKTVDFNECIDKWTGILSENIISFSSGLKAIRPKGIVLVQGFEPKNASLRAAALGQGFPCLALENTSRPDRLAWDNIAAFACVDNLSRNFYFRYRSFLSDKVICDYRTHFLAQYVHEKSEEHRSGSHSKNISLKSSPKGYIVFIAQVFTDAATLNCLSHWDSPLELLEAVADWCICNKISLVIKLHPKEKNGRNPVNGKKYSKLTLRKILDTPSLLKKLHQCTLLIDAENLYNTYKLINASSVVVTLASQAGLEAAIFGKPVVVGGRSNYSGLGFTYDAPSPWLLDAQMSRAFSSQNTDNSFEASAFAYIFFEKYCIPKTEESLAELCLAIFGHDSSLMRYFLA